MALQPYAPRRYAACVADIEKRGSYTPRRVRERRAYQLVVAGGVTGLGGVVLAIAAILGAGTGGWAVILLVVAAICAVLFRRTVGR
jgi:hypothetical protein